MKVWSSDLWRLPQRFAYCVPRKYLVNDLSTVEFSCVILSYKQRQILFVLDVFIFPLILCKWLYLATGKFLLQPTQELEDEKAEKGDTALVEGGFLI